MKLTYHTGFSIVVEFASCSRGLTAKLARRFEDLCYVAITIVSTPEFQVASTMNVHFVLVEDVGHVFVQPVELVTDREAKLLCFGLGNVESRCSLLGNPVGRANLRTRSAHRSHGEE